MFSSINTCWTLVGAFLVYFMQAGFALCEAGFTRAKNTGNILMKNMMDFCIGTPCYWIIGFGLMFGGTGALIGGFDPFIQGDYSHLGSGYPAVGLHRVPDRVLRHHRHHRFRLWQSAPTSRLTAFILLRSRWWSTPSAATGCGAAAGCKHGLP